jgi:hypothetical protein
MQAVFPIVPAGRGPLITVAAAAVVLAAVTIR